MSSTLSILEPATTSYQTADRQRPGVQTPVADWLHLVRAEYREMPDLHLTKPQVQRLWSLDERTTAAVVEALIEDRFLKRTHGGAYVRADS